MMKQKEVSNIETKRFQVDYKSKERSTFCFVYRHNLLCLVLFENVNICSFLFYRKKLGTCKWDKWLD